MYYNSNYFFSNSNYGFTRVQFLLCFSTVSHEPTGKPQSIRLVDQNWPQCEASLDWLRNQNQKYFSPRHLQCISLSNYRGNVYSPYSSLGLEINLTSLGKDGKIQIWTRINILRSASVYGPVKKKICIWIQVIIVGGFFKCLNQHTKFKSNLKFNKFT